MDINTLPSLRNLAIGYFVSVIVGAFVIEWIMRRLRKRSEVLKDEKGTAKKDMYLVRWLGVLERILYTTCVIFGQPLGISAWLAVKVITRWKSEQERWATISRSNIYLIGNLLTVFFGVIGGLLSLLLPK
jgi:hypothetical protein